MKCSLFYLLFLFFYTSIFCQSRTLISYELETGNIERIENVFIPNLSKDKTDFNLGSFNNSIADLPIEIDLNNLYEQSQWTNKKSANINFNINDFPLRASTKLFVIEDDSLMHNCSGIMVSSKHVLTAAHCISRSYQDFYVDSLLICPVYDQGEFSTIFECSFVNKFYVFENWSFWGEDFAILDLDEPVGSQTGWVSIAYDEELENKNSLLHKFSYPAARDLYNNYNGDTLYHSFGYPDIFDDSNIGTTGANGVGGESGSSLIDIVDGETYASYGVFTWIDDSVHSRMKKEFYYPILEVISNDLISSTIDHIENPLFNIFPNPSIDQISFTSENESLDLMLIRIYDSSGRLVLKTHKIPNDSIDISFLEDGLYMFRISNDAVDHVTRFRKIDF